MEKYYDQLVEYFSGNEAKAADRFCQVADWYYSDEIFAMTNKQAAGTCRMITYPSKMSLGSSDTRGKTYADTIKDRAAVVIQSYDDFEESQESGEGGVTKRQLKMWGLGFADEEYRQLDEHYKSLKEVIDTTDVVQDTLARDLCEIKVQQVRARNSGNVDSYQKFVKLYQDTLKTANLKARKGDAEGVNDEQACWGNFIRDVELFCPADYYQDKKMFKDFDSFGEYLERMVVRPVRNFLMGTRELDQEFSIENDNFEDPDDGAD